MARGLLRGGRTVGFVGSEALALRRMALDRLERSSVARRRSLLPTPYSPFRMCSAGPALAAPPTGTAERPAVRNHNEISHQKSCSGATCLPPPLAGLSNRPEPDRRSGSLSRPGYARKRTRGRRRALRPPLGAMAVPPPPRTAQAQSAGARPGSVRSHTLATRRADRARLSDPQRRRSIATRAASTGTVDLAAGPSA
jgi:hypothetical protein